MIAVPPIDCTTTGVLTAINAADLTPYNAATTYAANATCSYANRNWASVQAANTGHTPGTNVLWWVDAGPSNKMAMFDASVQTKTTRTGGLSWTLAVGRFTALGLMGLVGNSVTITISDGVTTIYSETRTLLSSAGTYYSFCFDALYQGSDATFTSLPSSPNCTVTIAITGAPTQVCACGLCMIGKQFFIGDAQYGFANPIEDRGRHYLDDLGNPVNLERGYSKGVTGSIVTDRANYNRLTGFLADHIGIAMLWIATPGQTDLVSASAVGRYTRSVVVIESYNQITLSLEIAGNR
jgi:hypothetical protein